MNPPFFSAELLQKILLDILYQVKAHYKCMYIIAELGEIQRQAVDELAMVSIQDFQEVRGARQKREREREIERTR